MLILKSRQCNAIDLKNVIFPGYILPLPTFYPVLSVNLIRNKWSNCCSGFLISKQPVGNQRPTVASVTFNQMQG